MFKGEGVAGSISIMDLDRLEVVREITGPAILMPVAAGIKGSSKAYVANIVSGQVTVIDLGTQKIVKNIPVTLTPDCRSGAQFSIFDTLQAPIQTPVSPDGSYVGVSPTTVDRACTGSPDHVTIIDTVTDTVVAHVGTSLRNSAGTHGANWGAKRGGGYYLHVANHLGVVDPDPNGDRNGTDATLVGRVLLGTGPDVTDGVGGQGIKPTACTCGSSALAIRSLGAGLWRFVAACTALVPRPARAWLPPPRAQPGPRLLPRRGAARAVLGIRLRRVSWMTADGVASAALAFLLLGGV